jgi:hypothetical protein
VKTKRVLLEVTEELAEAIDEARGSTPRSSWIEKILWQSPRVQLAAETLNIVNPDRPMERRGTYPRG